MAAPKFWIKPQKRKGNGWVFVTMASAKEAHWAVVKETSCVRGKQTHTSVRILARYQSKTKAEEHRDSLIKNYQPIKLYKLGQRMGPVPEHKDVITSRR